MAYKIKQKGTQFGTLTPSGEIKDSMIIDLANVKSDDPLAYAYGLFHGKSGKLIVKIKGEKLAPEYIRGYKEGRKEFLQKWHIK